MPFFVCRCGASARFFHLYRHVLDSPALPTIPHLLQCAECRAVYGWDADAGGWRVVSLFDDRDEALRSDIG